MPITNHVRRVSSNRLTHAAQAAHAAGVEISFIDVSSYWNARTIKTWKFYKTGIRA